MGGKRWLWLTDRRLYETVTTFFLPNFCCFPLLQSFTFWSVIRWLMFWCVEACSPRRFTTWRWFFSSAFLLWLLILSVVPHPMCVVPIRCTDHGLLNKHNTILCHESATMPTDKRDQRSYLLYLDVWWCFIVTFQCSPAHVIPSEKISSWAPCI